MPLPASCRSAAKPSTRSSARSMASVSVATKRIFFARSSFLWFTKRLFRRRDRWSHRARGQRLLHTEEWLQSGKKPQELSARVAPLPLQSVVLAEEGEHPIDLLVSHGSQGKEVVARHTEKANLRILTIARRATEVRWGLWKGVQPLDRVDELLRHPRGHHLDHSRTPVIQTPREPVPGVASPQLVVPGGSGPAKPLDVIRPELCKLLSPGAWQIQDQLTAGLVQLHFTEPLRRPKSGLYEERPSESPYIL